MKKLVLPVITLIIGLVSGYLISAKRQEAFYGKEKTSFIAKNKITFGPSPYTIITDRTIINRMRDEYRTESTGLFFGTNGASLNGFHIKRAELDKILATKNPDGSEMYEGISFYLGKQMSQLGKPVRMYTLLFMGAKKSTALTGSGFDDDPSTVYDEVDICPDKCGGF